MRLEDGPGVDQPAQWRISNRASSRERTIQRVRSKDRAGSSSYRLTGHSFKAVDLREVRSIRLRDNGMAALRFKAGAETIPQLQATLLATKWLC